MSAPAALLFALAWFGVPFTRTVRAASRAAHAIVSKGRLGTYDHDEMTERVKKRMEDHPTLGETAKWENSLALPVRTLWWFWTWRAWPFYWDRSTRLLDAVTEYIDDETNLFKPILPPGRNERDDLKKD